jgi:hypothetical protein
MTYDWEKTITQDMMDKIDAILPRGVSLMGLAVANVDSVEAALIENTSSLTGNVIVDADVWRDIYGDASRIYDDQVKKIF